ncbi:hypothetical protein [Paenibacillus dakarensis]|uniref:hypothetical protein n=1 Tax=Paenibacillus dakarensis TaxID=1527293 RepID=UPI0006D5A3E8|nr:hypothetical protein [Paenibacillus dakarensis]
MSENKVSSKSKRSSNARVRTRIKNNPKNIIRNKVVNFDPDYIKAKGGDSNPQGYPPAPSPCVD